MATKRKLADKPKNDSGPVNLAALDDMLEVIDQQIPVFQVGDRVEFVHAGSKFKGSVIKVLEEGKFHVADKGGTVFKITTYDVCKNGETASQLIARQKKGGKRPVYVSSQPGLKDEVEAEDNSDDDLMAGIDELMEGVKPAPAKKPTPAKEPVTKPTPVKKSTGAKTQKQLVEELAAKGETDYDVIAKKTGVTRVNVGQYMYRWKKANEGNKK